MSASKSPWFTGVERMIWVLVVPSFWNCKIRCSNWGMLPQLYKNLKEVF